DAWKEQLAKLGISYGVSSPFLRYSQDQEIEADLIAVRLLTAAHFDPNALLSMLEKLTATHTAEGAQLSTISFNHPQSENQAAQIEDEIAQISPPPYPHNGTSAEFRAFHSALQKLPFPIAEKETTEPSPDALPNVFTQAQDYYRLGYPTGWQVTRTGANG